MNPLDAASILAWRIPAQFIRLFQFLIMRIYKRFPCKWLLDSIYFRSILLQKLFKYHLNYGGRALLGDNQVDVLHGLYCKAYHIEISGSYKVTLYRLSLEQDPIHWEIEKPCVLLLAGLSYDIDIYMIGTNSLSRSLLERGFDVWIGSFVPINSSDIGDNQVCSNYRGFGQLYSSVSILKGFITKIKSVITYRLSLSIIGFSTSCSPIIEGIKSNQSALSTVKLIILMSPLYGVADSSNRKRNRKYVKRHMSMVLRQPSVLYYLFSSNMFSTLANWRSILQPTYFHHLYHTITSYFLNFTYTKINPERKLEIINYLLTETPADIVVESLKYDQKNCRNGSSRNGNRVSLTASKVIVLAGGRDYFFNEKVFVECFACRKMKIEIEQEYEHLDLLLADSAESEVYPKIFSALAEYSEM